MSSDPPIEPRPIKRRKTLYMKQVERNQIREMMQAGMSQSLIAQKRNYTDRQIRNYVREIRQEDYKTLMSEDSTARASAIQEAKINLSRLKARMLEIVFGEDTKITNNERIAAAEMTRQFELDLVNLRLNGPLAIGLRVGTSEQRSGRLSSRSGSEIEGSISEPSRTDSSESDAEPTQG